MLCGIVFFMLVALLVGSMIVRAAVSMANLSLKKRSLKEVSEEDEEEELDEWIGYRQKRSQRVITAIPEPSTGKAMICVLAIVLIVILAGVVVHGMLGIGLFNPFGDLFDESMLITYFLIALFSFPLSASIVSHVLGTTFRRACLCMLWCYLIPLAIVLGLVLLGQLLF